MSRNIDNRVVHMKFDHADFMKNAQQAFDSLGNIDNAIKGLTGGPLDTIANNVENANSKMGIFGVVAASALNRATNAAIDFGTKMVTSVIDPLTEGGKKRALNIEQAKFQFEGLGMDVEAAMADALYGVKDTAYGLDEAAVAAAQFGASGVKLGDDMQSALRGISGVAAMSGSAYSDVSSIFTKVAGQGRLMGDDLLRLSSRGINAAATIAKEMGTTEEAVREMVTKGEIDFNTFSNAMNDAFGEHATKANETYTGALGNMRAALSRVGAEFYTIKHENHRQLFNALTPVIDAVAYALGPVVDLYRQFSEASTARQVSFIEKLEQPIRNLRPILATIVRTIFNLRDAFGNITGPIKEAFKSVFDFGESTFSLSGAINSVLGYFERFTEVLAENQVIGKTVGVIFTVLFTIIRALGTAIAAAVGAVVLFAGKIRDAWNAVSQFLWPLQNIRAAVERVAESFKRLDLNTLDGWKEGLALLSSGISDIFTTMVTSIRQSLDNLVEGFKDTEFFKKYEDGLNKIIDTYRRVADWLTEFSSRLRLSSEDVSSIGVAFAELGTSIWNALGALWNWLSSTFGPGIALIFGTIGEVASDGLEWLTWDRILKGFDIALVAGIAYGIKDIIDTFTAPMDALSDIGNSFKDTLDAVTDGIGRMQQESKPTQLLKIAAAIGILAAAVWVLSTIDGGDLVKSLGAMVGVITIMGGTLVGLSKIMTGDMLLTGRDLAVTLTILGAALWIVSRAMGNFAKIPAEQLGSGLVAMAGSMAIMVAAVWGLSKLPEQKLAATAGGMVVMAGAMIILAGALMIYSAIDPDRLFNGLVGFGLTLAMAVAAMIGLGEAGPKAIAGAVALVIMANAMAVMAGVVLLFSAIPWDTFTQGMLRLAAAILLLVVPLMILGANGPDVLAAAGAMAILAFAVGMLVPSIITLGSIDINTLAQGLLGIAAVMVILAAAAEVMEETIKGAGAMVIMAFAVSTLIPPIAMLGALPLPVLIAGLVGLAVALGVIAAAGYLLDGAAVGLLAFGAAVLMTGTGVGLLAAGMTVLAAAIVSGGAAIIGAIASLIAMIPMLLKNVAMGIVGMIEIFLEAAPRLISGFTELLLALIDAGMTLVPRFVELGVTILRNLLEGIIELTPKIVETAVVIITELVAALVELIPLLVDAGFKLLIGILDGISNNIGELIDSAALVVVNFLEGLEAAIVTYGERIRNAGVGILTGLIAGIFGLDAAELKENVLGFINAIGDAVGAAMDVIIAIGTTIGNWIADGVEAVLSVINPMNWFKSTRVDDGTRDPAGAGITPGSPTPTDIMNQRAAMGIPTPLPDASIPIPFSLSGWGKNQNSILDNADSLLAAFFKVDTKPANDFGVKMGEQVELGFRTAMEIHSPSRVMMRLAAMIVEGLVVGIKQGLASVTAAVADFGTRILSGIGKTLKNASNLARKMPIEPKMDIKAVRIALDELTVLIQSRLERIVLYVQSVSTLITPLGTALMTIGIMAGLGSVGVGTMAVAMSLLATSLGQTVLPVTIITSLMAIMSGVVSSVSRTVMDSFLNMAAGIGSATTSALTSTTKFNTGMSKALSAVNKTIRRELSTAVRTANSVLSNLVRTFTSNSSRLTYAAGLMVAGARGRIVGELNRMRSSTRSAGYNVGIAITQGMSQGLSRGSANVSAAARRVASNALSAAKSTLGVRSPSREGIWLGEMFDKGFAQGLTGNTGIVRNSSSGVANTALDELRKVLSEIESEFDEDGFHPTIRPVVDLTDAETKLERFNSIFATDPITGGRLRDRSAMAAALYERNRVATAEEARVGESRIFNYTQNNHSPKALPKAEIYRRTKNQLSTVKGAIE